MALAPYAVWLMRLPLLILFASLVGALLGVLEGAAYPAEGGPRIPLAYYWATLAVILFLCLLAFARLVEPRTGRAVFQALGLLPVTVVVQDAVSLILQGSSPSTATWYAAVFGESFLTHQTGYAPGFYFVFAGLSAVLLLGSSMPTWRVNVGTPTRPRLPGAWKTAPPAAPSSAPEPTLRPTKSASKRKKARRSGLRGAA